MAISEFSLIERFFAPAGRDGRGVTLGIGDDCALLEIPEGQQLAVSIDTLVEGVHFLANMPADAIARRAFGACLSDLAAMGAEPAWITLALTLPEADENWLQAFSEALAEEIAGYGVCLVGGDTTRGHRTISLQVHGWVPRGQALTRSGASVGDHVFVTGSLGDSAAGLNRLCNSTDEQAADSYLISRFQTPTPRISTGILLRGFASAAIDISDGLLADLGHILEQSGTGARLEVSQLPLSPALSRHGDREQAIRWALSGGEDFELCFCIPDERVDEFRQAVAAHEVPCTPIGRLITGNEIRLLQPDGREQLSEASGYKHF